MDRIFLFITTISRALAAGSMTFVSLCLLGGLYPERR